MCTASHLHISLSLVAQYACVICVFWGCFSDWCWSHIGHSGTAQPCPHALSGCVLSSDLFELLKIRIFYKGTKNVLIVHSFQCQRLCKYLCGKSSIAPLESPDEPACDDLSLCWEKHWNNHSLCICAWYQNAFSACACTCMRYQLFCSHNLHTFAQNCV